ncbi:MAG: hypothetical protein A4E37_00060 [Methanoregulaceae archaeon PtaB.Bin056]|nr:MAG: hypothetical protein A4E37_00060 [Methanoregulaceae archaeon PtaB.Bin056]
MAPTTMLFVIPAPNIRTFGSPRLFSSSCSSGSTKNPIGITAMSAPMLLTPIFSTLQRIP